MLRKYIFLLRTLDFVLIKPEKVHIGLGEKKIINGSAIERGGGEGKGLAFFLFDQKVPAAIKLEGGGGGGGGV